MALNARDFKVTGQWAKTASENIPIVPIPGQSYREPKPTEASYEVGQPYDTIWDSALHNRKDYETTGIAKLASEYGIVPWSSVEDYQEGAVQLATDGLPYRCIRENGPGSVGPKDPANPANVGSDKYWITLAAFLLEMGLGGSYEAIPETLALRNEDARTQANDPIHDLDVVNLRTMMRIFAEMGGGGGGGGGGEEETNSVNKPTITAPPAGTVFESLQIGVTVSSITLSGGGQPDPAQTEIRVIDASDSTTIVASALLPYTVNPSAVMDSAVSSQSVQIMVRHSDSRFGWSPWSDRLTVSIATTVAKTVSVTYPVRNSANIPITGLTVTLTAGGWTDGSSYAGFKTNVVIRKMSDDSQVYATGWVNYTTSVAVPDGTLSPGENYWVAAQHRAASAPTTNPSASLDSSLPGKNDPEASTFTTQGATKPNVSTLQHNIPEVVQGGSFTTVKIWGATSADGAGITYSLSDITGGLAFSKTSGIGENEQITMVAPTLANVSSVTGTLNITAVSTYGIESDKVPVQVVVLMETEWIYTEDGTFRPPAKARYRVKVGGPGGRGLYGVSASAIDGETIYRAASLGLCGGAGGGGYSESILELDPASQSTVRVTVGKSDETIAGMANSSFGNYLSATKGEDAVVGRKVGSNRYNSAGQPGGYGVGGNVANKTGGTGGGIEQDITYIVRANTSVTPFVYEDYVRLCSGGGGAGPNDGGPGKSPVSDSYGVIIPASQASGIQPLAGGAGGGGTGGVDGEAMMSVGEVTIASSTKIHVIAGSPGKAGIAGGGAGCGIAVSGTSVPVGGRGCVIVTLLEIL